MRVSRALVVGLGASIVIACSSGSSGGGASSGSSFNQQYCQLLAPCCAKVNKPTDGKACELFLNVFTGNQTYDPVKGQACLDASRAASGSADFCTNGTSAQACNSVYSGSGSAGGGTKKPGDPCTNDSDCASSTEGTVSCNTSFDSKGGQTRICQLEIDGKAGDTPCIGTKSGNSTSYSSSGTGATPPPARGYLCDVAKNVYCSSKANACVAIADVGQDCDTSGFSYACVKSAYCDYATTKCVARLAVGADCSSSSTSCAEKAYCDQTSKKCTAALADGAPCASSQECVSQSCVNKACAASSSGGSFGGTLLCGN
jgi:hypothetical protein